MPKSAIDMGCVDKVFPLQDIPDETVKILEKKG
jgi:chemotaxis response regulator CheB